MPPYAAWSARYSTEIEQVVMGYFGVQSKDDDLPGLFAAVLHIESLLRLPHGPSHHDLAHYVDEAGFDTYIAIAYWGDPQAYKDWAASPEVESWWASPERLQSRYGYFREILEPRSARFETIYSTPDKFEGVATMAEGISGEILEHGYWGGMRDRLPASQTDPLRATGGISVPSGSTEGRRIVLVGHENLALIRSGQDWSETEGAERSRYLNEVAPILGEGMAFLRDHGLASGCYFNRYVRLVNRVGKPVEKTFGQSLWRSLEHMERWAESHPTHVAIFGTFMRMVQSMEEELGLRLYHEVAVVAPTEQHYEYLNCHPGTGLLRCRALQFR
jgi:aldoxime dehydratase